jgi:cystathionine beta-lyase/cystathionine gamma-synthase
VQAAALFSLGCEERRAAGLKDNLVRYALGIEDADDLIADLGQALAGIYCFAHQSLTPFGSIIT